MKCPHCLGDIEKKTKPRSLDQMRRFFAVLRAMYAHWPESAGFQPHSEEHLRKWVTCMAGHREVIKTKVISQPLPMALAPRPGWPIRRETAAALH